MSLHQKPFHCIAFLQSKLRMTMTYQKLKQNTLDNFSSNLFCLTPYNSKVFGVISRIEKGKNQCSEMHIEEARSPQ
ncbi:hypothetical protein BLOT_007386, partial [Blomia tropicalis]